jgi:hypothetical protein
MSGIVEVSVFWTVKVYLSLVSGERANILAATS